MKEQGILSVESENIFPVIKKWLYPQKDVFARELISNAADAVSKLKKLSAIGEYTGKPTDFKIEIEIDKMNSSITITDNGLGLDAAEVEKYINQIAFSGANEFLGKYKDKPGDEQIIGHFGLGFYSAFMVADKVTINSLSYKNNAESIFWQCDSGMNFTITKGARSSVGTDVTLHVSPASEYLNPVALEKTVRKYFRFFALPILIKYLGEENDKYLGYGTRRINDIEPLWNRNPADCTREDYLAFYTSVFEKSSEPVLWVHLYNPSLGLRGIVYFRDRDSMERSLDGTMHLYSNQVFVNDAAKGIIPEFLFFQDGIIDCQKLPLMVSRSDLQNDESVHEITKYITEQIAYKIVGTFQLEREYYEKIWEDLNPFVKFSCLKDKYFSSFVDKTILFRNLSGKYKTLNEYLEADNNFDPETKIYYVTDEIQQAHYISIFRDAGIDALFLTHVVDQPYIQKQELKREKVNFCRIDTDFFERLEDEDATRSLSDEERLENLFSEILEAHYLNIKISYLKISNVSSLITADEEIRRIKGTLDLYAAKGVDVSKLGINSEEMRDTLMLNMNNPVIRFLLDIDDPELSNQLCLHLFDLARLAQETLEASEMDEFIKRSNRFLGMIVKREYSL